MAHRSYNIHNPSNRASIISLQQNLELSNGTETFPLLPTYIFFQRETRKSLDSRMECRRCSFLFFFSFLTKTGDEGVDPRGGVVMGERGRLKD